MVDMTRREFLEAGTSTIAAGIVAWLGLLTFRGGEDVCTEMCTCTECADWPSKNPWDYVDTATTWRWEEGITWT